MSLWSEGLGRRALNLCPGQRQGPIKRDHRLEIETPLGTPPLRGYGVSPVERDAPDFLGSLGPSVCVQGLIEIGRPWPLVTTAAAAGEITVMQREGEDHGELGP